MFRRKQEDEDPFAALKDAAERGSTHVGGGASPRPSDGEGGLGVPAASQSASKPRGDRNRKRSNAPLVLLLLALSIGGAGAAIWFSERAATDADARADRGERPRGEQRGATDDDPGGATGDDDPSDPRTYDLVRPAGFRRALRAIEPELRRGESVRMLRVDSERVAAFTRTRSGAQRIIDVEDDLETSARDAGQAGSHRGMSLSRIPATAPSQAAARAARQGGFPARKLDYLVMTTPLISGEVEWSLFFRGVAERNSHWRASLDGRQVWRPGEQPGTTTSSSLTITTNGRTRTITGADAQRISECIRKAGSDGAKIQACLP